MSALASAEDMSPPVSPTPAPSVAPLPASPEPRAPVARCGHYIFSTASTSTNSLDVEFCTGCELRAAVSFVANCRTAEDPDAAYEGLVAWRKARLDLANFEFETEGTDGCSAGYELTLEQHERFCRDVALRLVEGDDAEQLKAEMKADEVEERAAAVAAMEAGMGNTTTTTTRDAQTANTNDLATAKNTTNAVNSALQGSRAGRTLSPPTNNTKRKRSRSVTHANSANVDGDEDSHAHRDEDSYRSSSVYSRHNNNNNNNKKKGSRVYVRGRWAAPPRSSWLDTSDCHVSHDKWERDARDITYEPRRTRSMARGL